MIDKLIGPVTGLLDKFIEDKDQKARLAHDLATMAEKHAQEISKAQLEVNKIEAGHSSLFVSGWRPAVGWVCVLGMAGNFMVIPFTNFVLALLEIDVTFLMIRRPPRSTPSSSFPTRRSSDLILRFAL